MRAFFCSGKKKFTARGKHRAAPPRPPGRHPLQIVFIPVPLRREGEFFARAGPGGNGVFDAFSRGRRHQCAAACARCTKAKKPGFPHLPLLRMWKTRGNGRPVPCGGRFAALFSTFSTIWLVENQAGRFFVFSLLPKCRAFIRARQKGAAAGAAPLPSGPVRPRQTRRARTVFSAGRAHRRRAHRRTRPSPPARWPRRPPPRYSTPSA